MSLEQLSVCEAAGAIRDSTLSPVDYAQALLSRIDALEPRIQAWVTIDREAVLSEASRLEDEARWKQFRGPLHGVPVGVKDIFHTKGLRTTMGSPIFKDFIPDQDARAVTKLKASGAIVLGKTVTTLFANLDPGPTRNPWNLEHTPGGSSSGSAAAVAARMCPAAIGTQTVGSVARPAGFCGIASIVPARERLSLKNVFPLAWSLDHAGIFARSAADLKLMLDVMSDAPLNRAPALTRLVRLGVIRDFFFDHATPEARESIDALAGKLAGEGLQVEEAGLPPIFDLQASILRTILRSETASIHEHLFPTHADTYGTKLRALIEMGTLVGAGDYLRAKRLRRRYQREMAKLFERFDVLLTPATPGIAPEGISTTGDPVMNGPWTLTDFPVMTLPCGLGSKGLPLGVQLTGPPLQEAFLLEIAEKIERIIEFRASAACKQLLCNVNH
jgi:aspartyl-tRNA(Asn)/glutamyl-tRNA(Gln) amidotransferase subunit A